MGRRRLAFSVLSDEDRRRALALSRGAIRRALEGPHAVRLSTPEEDGRASSAFEERRGAFVTLKRYPELDLRGCIGYPLPVLPLREALTRAAVAAALEDPRFAPVRAEELPRLAIEVSVLTVPTPLRASRPEALLRAIRVGRDGLIVEGFGTSGLLLPQVAPEEGWSVEELLAGTCAKAGLPPDAWRDPRVTVRRFEAEVFREATPGGPLADDGEVSANGGPLAPRS